MTRLKQLIINSTLSSLGVLCFTFSAGLNPAAPVYAADNFSIGANNDEGFIDIDLENESTENETTTHEIPDNTKIPYELIATPNVDEYYDEYSDFYDNNSTIELTWKCDAETNIDGFNIYRSTSPNGTFELIDSVYETNCCYSDSSAKFGITFYYKVEAFEITDEENIYYSSEVSNGVILPLHKTEITSLECTAAQAITVSWNKIHNVDGYYIYRSETKNGEYTLIKSLPIDKCKYTFTNKRLAIGQKYYYKVCPYVIYYNTKYANECSDIKDAIATIGKTKITKSASHKKACNTIYWKKNTDADGYIVYYSTKAGGKYKKLKTLSGKNKLSFTHKKLKNGKAYFYKVFAYKKIKNKKLLGISAAPYKKYCDFYTYADESYESKCKRIFGKRSRQRFKSNDQAMSNMTCIRIKVWDVNASGKKYTRYFYLTVHKNIAPSMQQMFKEIYQSKERFPIHDIGCYSWRLNNPSSEHCLGLAIDINSNENYMIDNGVILAGSFWNPKKSVYSIPKKCELVKILEKYGFYRGFWGGRKDYMHFSYFGT